MTEDEGQAFFARIDFLEQQLAKYQNQENKVSDISAGKVEIEKGLKVVIINTESLALREDIKDKREITLAINMLKSALMLVERVK